MNSAHHSFNVVQRQLGYSHAGYCKRCVANVKNHDDSVKILNFVLINTLTKVG